MRFSFLSRLIRSIVRLLSLPFIIVVCVTLRVIFAGREVRIVVMDPRLFGHQSLEPEVFWDDWQTDVEKGSQHAWFCCLGKKSSASNSHLWQLAKDKFPTLPSWFVTSVAHWKKRFKLSQLVLLDASIYRLGFLVRRETTLPRPETMLLRRREILSHLAEPERPYVVFTIREFDRASTVNELRNRQISDLVPAMSALVERGFNVVRVTSSTKDPIAGALEHVLDWQVLVNGRPGDELAVVSGASFVVSTTTGGDCLALAYRRPVLYLDSARFCLVFLGTELAMFQMPQFLDSMTGRSLSLEQLPERDLGWVGEQGAFAKAGVTVVNSDPQVIRNVVIQYHDMGAWRGDYTEDADDAAWREMLMMRHGEQVTRRHGPIRASMHPASKHAML